MTKSDALIELKQVIPTDAPWYKNPILSWRTAYETVLRAVEKQPDGELLDWLSRRIKEVLKNKKIKTCPNCGSQI